MTMERQSNSPEQRDIGNLLHPYTNLKVHEEVGPQIITRGKGIYVYDGQGKEYIEGLAGLWYASLGFSEERLVKAASDQMSVLPCYHTFAHKSNTPAIDLAENLISKAPVPMSKIYFTCSGSEAVDTAMKTVWYYNNALDRPQKKKIIARANGYHGVTIASGSLTGLPVVRNSFDLPIANILQTDCPHFYRFGKEGETEEQFATRLADNLEQLILDEGPETVAAFIAEPVMAAGGVITPPATYFEKIQAVLKRHDVLFIADEVVCGFGRTGNMWGSQTYNLKPDIITMAKAISSGYLPLGGFMINEDIFSVVQEHSNACGVFGHGYTYTGHPACAAVGLETQKIYEERGTFEYVREIAPYFQKSMQKFADHSLVGEVRGVGLVGAVELVRDKKTKESFDPGLKSAAFATARAAEYGLIVRALPAGDSIAFCPPLIITEPEIDLMMERFAQALDDTEKMINK